ncbi:succinate-semialdehyde dehydrogenase [Aspergillus caelatus]|uniref:succinate-semialdehyde dehydrogenase [NAD(P)(+)] n=1 Tax=Aspergillus caelatus TaxID=61420 RepID=A0A5N7AEH4_9EURO|nr:succinate-semialdehyde dehydrogenase [Aspergillus caelatus]KAE8368115.1 succinate-semialdehyde dehydrogenase [Aspergillus caelatus]
MSTLPFALKNPSLLRSEAYVNGQWVEAKLKKTFTIEDPGSGKTFATCSDLDAQDIDDAVHSSHEAFKLFRRESPRTRAELLLEWRRLILGDRHDIATILSYETGKPFAEALGEVDYSASFLSWFAGEAERIQGNVIVPATSGRRILVVKQPIGVCVALIPWNYPVGMFLRKVSAALAAGCSMVAKPSPETPLSTLALAHLAEKAGFAPGVLNVLTTSNENTPALSEALCKHPLVQKVSFTGSSAVGSIISRHCADGIKKLSLELGGNCPFIVFADANQDQAIVQLSALKFRHAGQACVTANRIYVHEDIYDDFVVKMVDYAKSLKVGHGSDSSVAMGPLTTSRGVEKAKHQVQDAVQKGAKVVHGGKSIQGGNYFEPTVIRDMGANMLITHEESFAPIAALYKFKTEEEVVRLANDTSMGLASYVFTKDIDRTWRMMESLEAGMIGVNTGASSAAESPFGGMKMSGYGKESGKDVAIDEYLVSKTCTLTLEGTS